MKRLTLFAILAVFLSFQPFAQRGEGGKQRPGQPPPVEEPPDCGGPRQEPCPEPPPPDDPPSDPSAPYPEAPPCETHDSTVWHGVWDSERGCHYDHHHGIDPFSTPFAPYVAEWGSLYEGEKHEGYKFLYFESLYSCQLYDGFGEGCVTRFLLRIHDAGTIAHLKVRRHSNRIIAEVCNTALTQCGVIEAGLLTDYGVTHCPYKQHQCELPDDPWTMAEAEDRWEQPPYRTSNPVTELSRVLQKGLNPQFWQSLGPNPVMHEHFSPVPPLGPNPVMHEHFSPVPNRNLQLAWSSPDAWGLVDPSDYASAEPSENLLGAPDFTNGLNNSRYCVINVRLFLPERSDIGPGFSGFTDDYGSINDNCEAFGPGCWPFSISETVPDLPTFSWSWYIRPDCSTTPTVDFDVCFDAAGQPMNCLDGGTSAGWLRPPGH